MAIVDDCLPESCVAAGPEHKPLNRLPDRFTEARTAYRTASKQPGPIQARSTDRLSRAMTARKDRRC